MLSEAWNGCAGVLCRVLYHTPPPFREQSRTRRICHKSRGRSARCQRRRGGAHAAVVIAAPLHTVDAGGERRRHRRRCRGQRGGATPGARVAAEQFDVFAVLSNALHLPARRASAHGKASRREPLGVEKGPEEEATMPLPPKPCLAVAPPADAMRSYASRALRRRGAGTHPLRQASAVRSRRTALSATRPVSVISLPRRPRVSRAVLRSRAVPRAAVPRSPMAFRSR